VPEGPSIVILKEECHSFKNKKILSVSGNTKVDVKKTKGLKILDFKSWGKHFLICFDGFYIRIHMLMFGSYMINERKEMAPRLSLKFSKGELNFYNCSITLIENDVMDDYNWETDVMSEEWNPLKAEKSVKKLKNSYVCDTLLDQEIFSGVGNIIKNEVLFRIRVNPKSKVKHLPKNKLKELVKEASNYSHDFYNWKKIYELRKHWKIYRQKECPMQNSNS
jgi:endonuclease-8